MYKRVIFTFLHFSWISWSSSWMAMLTEIVFLTNAILIIFWCVIAKGLSSFFKTQMLSSREDLSSRFKRKNCQPCHLWMRILRFLFVCVSLFLCFICLFLCEPEILCFLFVFCLFANLSTLTLTVVLRLMIPPCKLGLNGFMRDKIER